jgi:hypothetical protein
VAPLKRLGQFWWILTIVLLGVCTLLWLWAAAVHPRIYVEHGPMENFQVACLVVGCALLAWRARAATQPQERVMFIGLALFYMTFAIREFDTRPFNWPVVTTLLNGMVRNVWLGTLWLVVGYFAYRHRTGVFALGRKWLGTPAGRLLLLAGVLWLLGAVVDKADPFGSKARDMLAEELLEVNATLLMGVSAIASLLRAGQSGEQPSAKWAKAPDRVV